MFVIFGLVGVLVAGLIHAYLWKRLVRDTLRPGRRRRIGTAVAMLLTLLVPATLFDARSGRGHWLAWPGFLWLALMFYLLVILLPLEVPRLAVIVWWRLRRPKAAPVTPTAPMMPAEREAEARDEREVTRRLVLARGAAIFAGLTAAGITSYGVRTALGPPRLDRVQIPLAKLPRVMDGTRLAVVSDIHLGPLTGPHHVRRIVDMINGLDADLVAIVGDLVDGSVAELGAGAAALADLRARHGAYFVTGNHEYYSGFQQWIDEVARLGVQPLRNARREIQTRGGVLDLAGVNDVGGAAYADGPDYAKALDGRDPSRPVVLMAHQPVQAHEAARHGVDLQVSGHTHGGQMAPFNLLVRLQQPVVSGLGTVDGLPVYVTNGAGFWGPPVRVGAPPQVSLVELRYR